MEISEENFSLNLHICYQGWEHDWNHPESKFFIGGTIYVHRTPYVHAVTNNYYYLESIQRLLSPVNHRGEQANNRPIKLLHTKELDVSF